MTKDEAIREHYKIKCHIDESKKILNLINKIYESKDCNGCKHYLSENGNYPIEPCSECSRFYSDKFERLEK